MSPVASRVRRVSACMSALNPCFLFFMVGLATLSCSSAAKLPVVTVSQPPPANSEPADTFMAAVVEVDLTPPPGYPIFGYSVTGAKEANGYQSRLKGRVLVLDALKGGRIFLLQAELGAASALLTRRIAAAAADVGAAPDRVMFAATHTHGGPGGYFGNEFYNTFGAGSSGFDPGLLDWLTRRFSEGIHRAVAELAPAVAADTTFLTNSLIRNRSVAAWEENFRYTCSTLKPRDVDQNMTVLRIDRIPDRLHGDEVSVPMAALVVFPIHSTCMPPQGDLYQADLQSVASRVLAAKVLDRYGGEEFVATIFNGAEGDVSPDWNEQTRDETIRIGSALGEWAFRGFERLDGSLRTPKRIERAYAEIGLPGALTSQGRICERAEVGSPTAGGAEDGYSGFEFLFQEGDARVDPSGCQSYKKTLLKFVQREVFNDHFFPLIVPFQVIRIDDLVLATIPGEPTTEVGRAIKATLKLKLQSDSVQVVIVGLANDYAGYFTTADEFRAQHYEGASTLYGPLQSLAALEQLKTLVGQLSSDSTGKSFVSRRSFFPGEYKHFVTWGGPCHSDRWRAGATQIVRDGDRIAEVEFQWKGLSEDEDCDGLPQVMVTRGGAQLIWSGLIQDDNSLRMIVRHSGGGDWRAIWTPPEDGLCNGNCQIVVASSLGDTLRSVRF